MNLLILLIFAGLRAAIATDITFRNHSCVPTGFSKVCFLDRISYNSHDQRVIHRFPANLTHVRLGGEVVMFRDFKIQHFDTKLYGMMGKPRTLEVINLWVRTIQLPRTVQHADFRRNILDQFEVEPGEDAPLLTYLHLGNNWLSNIANLSVLVNLEVLLLQNNHIEHIDHSTMQNLTKLRHLDLTHNFLTQFSTQVFPKSLTYLSLNSNEIKLLNYDGLYFPPLLTLNLERNDLPSIDASALILAMPKLKMVRFGGNPIDPNEFRLAVQQFRKHNVSVNGEADEVACLYKEEVVEGVCVRLAPPRNVIREILLSLVVVLVVIAMVVTVWWVFVTINKKC
ncbi:uncharacterized protein LOC6053554 [Culex quinquefasciatus]|uniref:uncharacterized protein LOC6053554 n=1 Tax=Culex quinquefasciatus TaxID=7176 RepID=UPI0018E32173|nr:uncharacterized protein LOC6053554 [Culex quinquefasciatus]